VAELANVVKGYGEVRRRLSGALARCLDEVVRPAIEADPAAAGFTRAAERIRTERLRLLSEETPSHPLPSGTSSVDPLPSGKSSGNPLPSGESSGNPLPSGERAG
jgi:hypothetical protein